MLLYSSHTSTSQKFPTAQPRKSMKRLLIIVLSSHARSGIEECEIATLYSCIRVERTRTYMLERSSKQYGNISLLLYQKTFMLKRLR